MPAPNHPLHEALFHYYCEFDATQILRDFAVSEQSPQPGAVRNFLGATVPITVFPPILEKMSGLVEGIPNPGNWHADIAEWASALYAVSHAKDTFRIVELGCGWGCWLVNTGVAARARGLKVDLIGIEGDANHLRNAEHVLTLNGFDNNAFTLCHGVAAPRSGKAIFPNPDADNANWGGAAIFFPDPKTLDAAKQDPDVQILDCHPLGSFSKGAEIDLLHIDIQGAEADFIEGNFVSIQNHVRRVLIGTHSRMIEGQLEKIFLDAGWRMEMDRPAIAPLQNGRPVIAIDGVQMWANTELA